MAEEPEDDPWGSDRIGMYVVLVIIMALLVTVLVLAFHEDSQGVVGAVSEW